MKLTVLVYDENNKGLLREADKEEWTEILRKNRSETSPRRYFIQDSIWESDKNDRMYIECTKEEYTEWHREAQNAYRRAKQNYNANVVSYNVLAPDNEESIISLIGDDFDWDARMISDLLMHDLKSALAAWKPWATEMLELYLNDKKRQATKILSEKYCVSEQTIRMRKREFEAFVISFLA